MYEVDEEGRFRAVLPLRCALAQGTAACSLFVDHYRSRKTGPRYPLAVVGCSAQEGQAPCRRQENATKNS